MVHDEPAERQPEADRVGEFADLFAQVYLTYHRRDGPRAQLSGASRAVLNHLALTGPLAIGEAAEHLSRAQSVVSDIVTQLERNGLLERTADPRDRRRTLVWLTDDGMQRLERDRRVLDTDLLTPAIAALPPTAIDQLIQTARALIAAAPTPSLQPQPQPRKGPDHDHNADH